jgi:hypothetical protein
VTQREDALREGLSSHSLLGRNGTPVGVVCVGLSVGVPLLGSTEGEALGLSVGLDVDVPRVGATDGLLPEPNVGLDVVVTLFGALVGGRVGATVGYTIVTLVTAT